jgi:DnaJ-class molecular chaperone
MKNHTNDIGWSKHLEVQRKSQELNRKLKALKRVSKFSFGSLTCTKCGGTGYGFFFTCSRCGGRGFV